MTATSLDPEVVRFLRQTLDETWASLSLAQRARTSRAVMAQRMIQLARDGERDPARLRGCALAEIAPWTEAPS